MKLFAVRHRETHEAVGIFWSNSSEDLWWDIDAVTDPGICEVRVIKTPFAVVWEGSTNTKFGEGISEEDEDKDRMSGVSFCERGLEVFFDTISPWKRVPCFDEPGGGYETLKRLAEQRLTKKREAAVEESDHG